MSKRKNKKATPERKEVDKGWWIQSGPIPISVAVVFTEKQWDHVIEVEKIPPELARFVEGTAARCNFIEDGNLPEPLCIVQFDIPDTIREPAIVGIMAHEMMHVWQFANRWMNNPDGSTSVPSDHWELQAYFLQHFTQNAYASWLEHCKRIGRKRVE